MKDIRAACEDSSGIAEIGKTYGVSYRDITNIYRIFQGFARFAPLRPESGSLVLGTSLGRAESSSSVKSAWRGAAGECPSTLDRRERHSGRRMFPCEPSMSRCPTSSAEAAGATALSPTASGGASPGDADSLEPRQGKGVRSNGYCAVLSTRKPRFPRRAPGLLPRRLAGRQYSGPRYHPPPR